MPLDRPIPAFYCCYLLRSTVRRSSVYIGSTPNPVRRLGQHNGLAKGGAARTARPALRPWEMACIVTGFPSQIAALQFEWAWQNPHVTQHIPAESRLQRASPRKKSGLPKRPRHGVSSLLSNLHLLLRVPSFSRWPLEIRFFSEDVHAAWVKWSQSTAEPIRDSISVIQDFPPESAAAEDKGRGPEAKKRKVGHGIAVLEIGYAAHKVHLEKGKEMVEFEREGSCTLCKKNLEHDAGIYAICPTMGCESVTHLTCLGKHFTEDEDEDSVLPVKGSCPSCRAELLWVDVAKEATLRMRGQKEVDKLLKVKRVRNGGTASQTAVETFDDDLSDEDIESDIAEELQWLGQFSPGRSKTHKGDGWHDIDDSDDWDTRSSSSTTSRTGKAGLTVVKAGTLRTVVEDSDWEEALAVD